MRAVAALSIFFLLFAAPFAITKDGLATVYSHAQVVGAAQPTQSEEAKPAACTSWYETFTRGECFVRPLIVGFGGISITLAGTFLSFSGLLFNFLLDATVLGFSDTYGIVKVPLENGWGVLRDIANIAIIGSFVFVAIATILNVEDYGVKRFVARIIIVAILINFSMLFTKLAIDVSHLIAKPFADAIAAQDAPSASQSLPTTLNNPRGAAGVFLKAMGLKTVWDTKEPLERLGQDFGNSAIAVHVVSTTILFTLFAIVLLYGSFLLLTRLVALILLIFLSALAVGSYAVPRLNSWWEMWFNKFMENIFFAPILMMFLWISLQVTQQLGAQAQGSLGAIAGSKITPGTVGALFTYFLILAMFTFSLYAAKKMSVMGSNALPDWQSAAKWATFGAASNLTGVVGVNTLGRGSNAAYKRWGDRLAEKSDKGGPGGFAARLGLGVLRAGRTSSYNPTLGAKSLKDSFKGSGSGLFTMDGGKGGYVAKLEKINKELKNQVSEKGKFDKDAKVWKEPEKIAKTKEIEELHKGSKPKDEYTQEILSSAILGAVKKNKTLLTAHKTESEEVERTGKLAKEITDAIKEHDSLTDTSARKAQADAIMSRVEGAKSIEDARRIAVQKATSATKKLVDKLAETGEGLSLVHGATKKAAQQINNAHVAETARRHAEKKHGGNMVKGFVDVLEALKGKSDGAKEKDVIKALDKKEE